ncbi:MAG: sugar O-acetyltransferase [Balneolales bacterium]
MTNREKMLSGQPYNAMDKELIAGREKAAALLRQLNATTAESKQARAGYFRELFGSSGRETWIESPFYCDYGSNIFLGEDVYFNFNCIILDPAKVQIGDRCLFGPSVQIYTATHPLDYRERRKGLESAREIRIGSDTWIGGGAIILPGTVIGSQCVIGAGSVVTRDIPEQVFAAGNPCRVIKSL